MNRTLAVVSLVVVGIVVILVVVQAQRPWEGCSANFPRGAVTTTNIVLTYPAHVGKSVCFRGRIVQVVERGTTGFDFVIEATSDEWGYALYATWDGPRYRVGDIVEFAGEVVGLKTDRSNPAQPLIGPEIDVLRLRRVT